MKRMTIEIKKLHGRRKNRKATRTAIKAFCGGIWTQDRAIQSGYNIEDATCPLCMTQEDSLDHRLFKCSHTEAVKLRKEHAWAISKMKDNVDKDPLLARRAIWDHPAAQVQPPLEEGGRHPDLGRRHA